LFQLRKSYTYNGDGALIEVALHSPKGDVGSKHVYTYDEKGNRLSDTYYYYYGPKLTDSTEKTLFTYDEKGNKIEEAYHNGDGTKAVHPILKVHKIVFTYNDKGKVITQSLYNIKGSLITKGQFSYDTYGNLIEQSGYHKDVNNGKPSTYRYTYEFDSMGNWIKQVKKKGITNSSKSISEPEEVIYRVISYY